MNGLRARLRFKDERVVGGNRNRLIAFAGLILLSALYCLPGHPSAGSVVALDVFLHIALFASAAVGFGLLTGSRGWAVATVAALGALLEVGQWWLGGYPRIEGADILSNEAGVALAAMTLWLFNRRHSCA